VRTLSIVTVRGNARNGEAQQPNQQGAQQPEKTFTSAAEVQAMIAEGKERKGSPISLTIFSVVEVAPDTVKPGTSYRLEGIDTPATFTKRSRINLLE